MRIALALPSLLMVAACVAPEAPAPQAARLSQEVLTLTLSDGTVCRAR